MNDILLNLTPNVMRKTISDIGFRFPGIRILPIKTHEEMGNYFDSLFGRPETRLEDLPDIIITAYPQVIGNKDWIEKSGFFQPIPEDLPPLRSDLRENGFSEPTVYFRMIAIVPLILIYNKNDEEPPLGWEDLLDEGFFGRVVCAPEDTPVPRFYRFYLRYLFGERAEGIIAHMDYKLYPLDINMKVDGGVYRAGLLIPAFARSSRGGNVVACWPKEGAIAVPLVALLRKGACPEAIGILRYLLSTEYQRFISQMGGLIPVRENVPLSEEIEGKLLWAGWDAYRQLGGIQ